MKKPPLVSIILPTYNGGDDLIVSVKSILCQSYSNFELIIIDDNSTDNTREIIENNSDPRILYIRHQQKLGAGAARNSGIKISKGEFIAFQDSDDIWIKDKLKLQIDKIEKSDDKTGAIYSFFLKKKGSYTSIVPSVEIIKKEGWILEELLKHNFIGTPTLLVKRSCFDEIGLFDEYLPRFQDWELCLRLAKKFQFGFIEDPLIIANFREGSISSNKENYCVALSYIIEKHFSEFRMYPEILSNHYLSLGLQYLLLDSKSLGKKYLIAAINTTNNKIRVKIIVNTILLISKSKKLLKILYNLRSEKIL